jgi:plastocyanin
MKKLIGSKSRFLIGITVLIAILSISNSCSKSADYTTPTGTPGTKGTGPGANEVWIQGMAFSPATITVTAGTTITWTNKDAVSHTVTSNSGLFNSGNLSTNSTYSFTFSTAGSYSYYCAIHPSMTAKVVVN